METLKIQGCHVASVRADMLKGVVKITFETALDEQMLEAKRELALLAYDNSLVDIVVIERQMTLPLRMNVAPMIAPDPESGASE